MIRFGRGIRTSKEKKRMPGYRTRHRVTLSSVLVLWKKESGRSPDGGGLENGLGDGGRMIVHWR